MTESKMSELIAETDKAMTQIGAFLESGEPITKDDLFDLSGLLHFVGNRLGTLSIQCPGDEWLKQLLEMCVALQVQCIEKVEAMAQLERGAVIH
ncbi:hypothetical protein PQR75_06550 [Paraburkholderia fungorum]|uniref:hypothetical protein n=1 Tax=Paraburkholderia fungorum TaxID=134537 RepID=UPI0038BB201D